MNVQMSVEETITEMLNKAFVPQSLEVENDSHRHADHAGSPGTGESHFRVHIVSEKFNGLGRVERHRLVNEALGNLLSGRIHALAIKAEGTGE